MTNDEVPMETDPTFGPILSQLGADDAATRLQAVKSLSTLALALGPERTRAELMPYLEGERLSSLTARTNATKLPCSVQAGKRHWRR
jgi:hypothetical protein